MSLTKKRLADLLTWLTIIGLILYAIIALVFIDKENAIGYRHYHSIREMTRQHQNFSTLRGCNMPAREL